MLRMLDLFSGIGGMSLALKDIATTVMFCDICPNARQVLLQRMVTGHLDSCPVHEDVAKLDERTLPADVDIIAAAPSFLST